MGQAVVHLARPEQATDEAIRGMSEVRVSAMMKRLIATKMERIPPADRTRVWTAQEVAALSSEAQAWAELADDPHGVRFDYPTTWELLGPVVPTGMKRYERIVRTGHLFRSSHARTSAEVAVGLAPFNVKRPKDAISEATFAQFTAQMASSVRRIPNGTLVLNETLPARSFKGSCHAVVHNIATFAQADTTTSRVEQWLLLSRDRTTMCAITLFNVDLTCWEVFGAMQMRILESVALVSERHSRQF